MAVFRRLDLDTVERYAGGGRRGANLRLWSYQQRGDQALVARLHRRQDRLRATGVHDGRPQRRRGSGPGDEVFVTVMWEEIGHGPDHRCITWFLGSSQNGV